MGIDNVAAVAACSRQASADNQNPDSRNAQLTQLQRLEQTMQKMKNDYRTQARERGDSGLDIQAKMREFDSLIGKLDNQIRQLERQQQSSDDKTHGRLGVSMLQYNTDATRITLRSTGESIHTVLARSTSEVRSKFETEKAQAEQAEKTAQAKEQAVRTEEKQPAENAGSLDLLA